MDQLPTVPGLVLRFASVLGAQFSPVVLLDMLPEAVASDLEALQEQLEALQRAHLIAPAAPFDTPTADAAWQFCSHTHQEVVYGTLPHSYRRSLHSKAAAVVQQKLATDGADEALQQRALLQLLTHHLLHGLPTPLPLPKNESRVEAVADALRKAATNAYSLGFFRETLDYMVRPRIRSAVAPYFTLFASSHTKKIFRIHASGCSGYF
jgi:hypothetical protein